MATTIIKPSSYVVQNNKIYIALIAVILAVLLGFAYASLLHVSTTIPDSIPRTESSVYSN